MWLVPAIEKFPRTQKFLLCDRIQTTALDVLECLIEATYTRDRKGQLARANLGIEKLRFFFRLSVELHYLDRRRYQHAARTLDDIGRLIGGWAKAHAAASGKSAGRLMAKRHDHLFAGIANQTETKPATRLRGQLTSAVPPIAVGLAA